jgi:hypothetical protein
MRSEQSSESQMTYTSFINLYDILFYIGVSNEKTHWIFFLLLLCGYYEIFTSIHHYRFLLVNIISRMCLASICRMFPRIRKSKSRRCRQNIPLGCICPNITISATKPTSFSSYPPLFWISQSAFLISSIFRIQAQKEVKSSPFNSL